MWNDFKEFALKGNVLDLAVAVVIGAAFGKIVTSLVENIITPLVGILFNGVKFTGLKYQVGDTAILYGEFLQSIFDFFVISASIFLFIRLLMKIKRNKAEVEEEVIEEVDVKEDLLIEIRDLLKEQNKSR